MDNVCRERSLVSILLSVFEASDYAGQVRFERLWRIAAVVATRDPLEHEAVGYPHLVRTPSLATLGMRAAHPLGLGAALVALDPYAGDVEEFVAHVLFPPSLTADCFSFSV